MEGKRLTSPIDSLLTSWPRLEELSITRPVRTNSPPSIQYHQLRRLSVHLVNNDALVGLADFLPRAPHVRDVVVASCDPTSSGFSVPLFTSTLLSLSSLLTSLTVKVNHESSLGAPLSAPMLDAILPNLPALSSLELASHGFSSFDFIHHLPRLQSLAVVHVADAMKAFEPWSWDDLAREVARVGKGRKLVVSVSLRGGEYDARVEEGRRRLREAEGEAEGRVEVWVGREGGHEVRRLFPEGAAWS